MKLGKNEASPVSTPPVGDDGVDSFPSATVLIVEREREREEREREQTVVWTKREEVRPKQKSNFSL